MASTSLLYYCHSCDRRISPITDDFICPNCRGGFVEFVEDEEDTSEEEPSEVTRDTQNGSSRDQAPQSEAQSSMANPFSILQLFQGLDSRNQLPNFVVRNSRSNDEAGSSSAPYDLRSRNRPSSGSSRGPNSRGEDMLIADVMQRVLGGFDPTFFHISLGGGGPGSLNFMQLHGNSGDYAWGPNGLDNVISQLLGQLENAGPPPASKQAIENLPTQEITQKDVDVKKECSVCMDPFKLSDTVKKLPCEHFFHIPCIDPWLELHNTCPICRKYVDEESCSGQSSSSSSNGAGSSNNSFSFFSTGPDVNRS
ncbi:unnamed protein product [Clavelina lepadiformis]|uniref:RING-type E3 ubiquitin transferase n=1 Tax=Clavelina lepadiformis TaxID=159417 RepID=A0ABP0GSQ1_CLALP